MLRLCRGPLRVGTISALAAWLAIGSVAIAGDVAQLREEVVALGFDTGSHSLIKAYSTTIYRSTDQGRNWKPIGLPKAIEGGRIVGVAVAAGSSGVLYIAGRGMGVLRSSDGGRTWVARNRGLPSHEVVALTSHATLPKTLYVDVSGHGIYRSQDAGGHWRLMDGGPRGKLRQLIHSNMPGSMQTGWFFAATAKGVARSMDCFCGWRDAGELNQAMTAVAFDPQQPKRVYAATSAGLFLSADGGEQWSRQQSPGPEISALLVTPTGTLYAAVGKGELFRSADHGTTWRRVDA